MTTGSASMKIFLMKIGQPIRLSMRFFLEKEIAKHFLWEEKGIALFYFYRTSTAIEKKRKRRKKITIGSLEKRKNVDRSNQRRRNDDDLCKFSLMISIRYGKRSIYLSFDLLTVFVNELNFMRCNTRKEKNDDRWILGICQIYFWITENSERFSKKCFLFNFCLLKFYPRAALLKKSVSPSNGTCSISLINCCWNSCRFVKQRLYNSRICFNKDWREFGCSSFP